jgi:hypothetical protein
MKKIYFYSTSKVLKNSNGRTVVNSACAFSAEYGEYFKDRVEINIIDQFGLITDRSLWNECSTSDVQEWVDKGLIKEYTPLNYPNYIKLTTDEYTPSDVLLTKGKYKLFEQNFFILLDNLTTNESVKISKRDFSTLYKDSHIKFITNK